MVEVVWRSTAQWVLHPRPPVWVHECAEGERWGGTQLKHELSGHGNWVYGMQWSADDQLLVSASSDYTAKVWDMSPRPWKAPVVPDLTASQALNATVHMAKQPVLVLRHSCFVYAALFARADSASGTTGCAGVLTAAYDGMLRYWNTSSGRCTAQILLSPGPVNALVLEPLGSRVFAGTQQGSVLEVPLTQWLSNGSTAAATAAADAEALGGGTGVQTLRAPASKLSDYVHRQKVLDEVGRQPIVSMALDGGGQRLAVLARGQQLCLLDTKLLSVLRHLRGVRCISHPLRCSFSPDGAFVVSGSEDGRVLLWDTNSGSGLPLRHMSSPGCPLYCADWNPRYHVMATCSFQPFSTISLFCRDSAQPSVKLQVAASGTEKAALDLTRRPKQRSNARRRELPEVLTPELVRGMVSTIRDTMQQQGLVERSDTDPGHLLYTQAVSTLRRSRGLDTLHAV